MDDNRLSRATTETWRERWMRETMGGNYAAAIDMLREPSASAARLAILVRALESIANNTCCDNCQEAARVAQRALMDAIAASR